MAQRHCRNCDQHVNAKRPWSWGGFILATLFTLGLGIVLYPLHWLCKLERCPKCNGRNWDAGWF